MFTSLFCLLSVFNSLRCAPFLNNHLSFMQIGKSGSTSLWIDHTVQVVTQTTKFTEINEECTISFG